MSKLSRVEKRTVAKAFDGLVTEYDASTLKSNQFQTLQNFISMSDGTLRKRPGVKAWQTDGAAVGILKGPFFPSAAGGENIVDLAGRFSTDYGKTWITIPSLGSQQDVCQYNGILYFVGTSGVWKWTGSGSATAVAGSPSGYTIVAFKDRLWICQGQLSTQSTLYFSDVGPTGVETWGASSFLKIQPGEYSLLNFAQPVSDRLMLFKQQSIWFLYPVGTVNSWSLRIANPERGAQSPYSVRYFEGFIYFVAFDGLWRTDGVVYKEMSVDVRNLFKGLFLGFTDMRLYQFDRFFYVATTNTLNSFFMLYNADKGTWATVLWNMPVATIPVSILSIRSSFFAAPRGETVLMSVSAAATQRVVQLDFDTSTDLGNNFVCKLRTGVQDFDLMAEEKRGKLVIFEMSGEGAYPKVIYGRDNQYDEEVVPTGSLLVDKPAAYRMRGPGYFRNLEIQLEDSSNSPLLIWQWMIINQIRALIGQPVI